MGIIDIGTVSIIIITMFVTSTCGCGGRRRQWPI